MSITRIPTEEIEFHPTSFCDRAGRLFWWKGELYRGITKQRASVLKKLFDDDSAQGLVDKGLLIDTELTELAIDGYELVVKHRRVPFVSYASEWCPEMFRDTALCIADLEIELTRFGLTLSDADPWNILFDGCRPLYVDFSNIRPIAWDPDRSWRQLHEQFYSCFIYPLVRMSQGYGHLARLLLTDREYGVIQSEFAGLMGYRGPGSETNEAAPRLLSVAGRCIPRPINSIAKKGLKLFNAALSRSYSGNYQARRDAVQQLRQELEDIPMPEDLVTTRDDENFWLPLAPSDRWTQKHHAVYKVLSDLCPSSVLDIGSSQGWYSQLAASLGSNVVALDVNDRLVARCYREAKSKNLPILPLVMNLRSPSPGYGLCNKEVAPAFQRLQCDLVLALGLVHLLVFKYYVPFEQIVETLATFARRWLLVEFIPREDGEVRNLWLEWLSWYTLDQFQAVLRRYFNNITILPSHPQRRILLLCEKLG